MVSNVSAVYVLSALVLFAPVVCGKREKVSAEHLSTSQDNATLAECPETPTTTYDKWMAIHANGITLAQMYSDKTQGGDDKMDENRPDTDKIKLKFRSDQTTPCDCDTCACEYVKVQDGPPVSVGPNTLLLVIDMQNDFVEGSFQQPCEDKRRDLTEGLRDLIGQFQEKKGSVIASMDYHSPEHCSFKGFEAGSCGNTAWLSDSDKVGNRYKNSFPSHTLYDIDGEQSVPRSGARLNPKVAGALKKAAKEDPSSVHLIFKGFNEQIESFSAMPHLVKGEAEVGTGGYALKGTGTAEACFGIMPPNTCFPTAQQLKDPDRSTMRRANEVVKEIVEKKGITDIVVAGLVHDYCVKETAIFTKKWVERYSKDLRSEGLPEPRVSVLMELSRPAFEGSPYFNLGTDDHNLEVAADLARHGVPYVTLRQLGIDGNEGKIGNQVTA